MPFNAADLAAASAAQTAAATSNNPQVRLVAGPGAGKSKVIEERVGHLLDLGVEPNQISVVSFTRASAQDLGYRIRQYGSQNNIPEMQNVKVTTLHSLALKVLRQAGLLEQYPADPIVLAEWETDNIFDAEFSAVTGWTPTRCAEIRRHNEAFWQTGAFNPPNFIPPDPPIAEHEQASFQAFHLARSQLYSCVLPGEIIRQCVQPTRLGLLNPNALVALSHLIVDEFQDLNPLDQEFVDHFAGSNVRTFICGDDDQSVYSFRFAAPQGIQNFVERYEGAADYSLQHCFRYGPHILNAGAVLMAHFPVPNRLPKAFISMYANSIPPVPGEVFRWRFGNGGQEAHGIAITCRRLIDAGLEPNDILILLSDRRALARPIEDALAANNVPFESTKKQRFADTDAGRIVLACLRIVGNRDDYVALRILLGELSQVGIGTCNAIAARAIANALNFKALFYDPLPGGVFAARHLSALNRARLLRAAFDHWTPDDTLTQRAVDFGAALESGYGVAIRQQWEAFSAPFPQDLTLRELRDLISAATDEQITNLSKDIYARLGLPEPQGGFVESRVRIMTMHGAKGLSAKVVFVPGLEEDVFPGTRRQPYPGLILEGARLLYVSMTRARAALFLSYAMWRYLNGTGLGRAPSRYAAYTDGMFNEFGNGLSQHQIQTVLEAVQNL